MSELTNIDTSPEEHLDLANEYASYLGTANPHSDAHLKAAQVKQLRLSRAQRYPDIHKGDGARFNCLMIAAGCVILLIIYALVYSRG